MKKTVFTHTMVNHTQELDKLKADIFNINDEYRTFLKKYEIEFDERYVLQPVLAPKKMIKFIT